jgi:hypothetical protein
MTFDCIGAGGCSQRFFRPGANNSPLKNGLSTTEKRAEHHRDVVPNFAGSQRAKKIVRLAEAPLVNR